MARHNLSVILALIQARDMAALATTNGAEPHASLMAYVTGNGGRTIYLATGRDSIKHRNMQSHPRVSLLIDTREISTCPGAKAPRSAIQAVTVGGHAEPVPQQHASEVDALFRAAHPHLHSFLDNPDTVLLAVRVESLLLLDGATDATFMRLQDAGSQDSYD